MVYWRDGYVVVGFPRCGTTSLMNKLPKGTPRFESAYIDNSLRDSHNLHPERRPVFIIREPVERTWSVFCYDKIYDHMTLEEWLLKGYKNTNPVVQADYGYFINKWKHQNPIIVKLESFGEQMKVLNKRTRHRPMNKEERTILERHLYNAVTKYQSLATNDEGEIR